MILMGFGDYIDASDPCTTNPSDPVCQQFGTVQDPCAVNPAQPFCQQAIVAASTGSTLNPTSATSTGSAAAALPLSMSSWSWGLLLLLVGAGGYALYRHEKKIRGKA